MSTVRTIGRAPVVLFTAERAYGAALRHWVGDEARRVAVLLSLSRCTEDAAFGRLMALLENAAKKAGIATIDCGKLAASMLDDEMADLDALHQSVLRSMIEAVRRVLASNPEDFEAAATEAAEIARANEAPVDLIRSALRIAVRAP